MKTIFVSAFEGVEAKNILRTDILPTMLSAPDINIVVLMKSAERIALYKKEITDPHVIFEIAPYSRRASGGFDRFFSSLKFTLLRTPTKDLQRWFAYTESGNYFVYIAGMIVKFVLARSFVRRIVRKLDFLLVRDNTYKELFDRYSPDLVFLAHLFEEPEINILREAKHRGIKTIGLINSWDKVTSRCIIRILPDKAIVFNDIVKNELVMYDEMNQDDIFVSGIPQYDIYFKNDVSSREEFFKRINIDPKKKLILFSPAGRNFSGADWAVVDMLDRMIKGGVFSEEVSLLVRFPPNDLPDLPEIEKRQHIKIENPGMRFSSKQGVDWDMNDRDSRHLRDTLFHMSILISYASSMSIDAAVFDKPVINLNFEVIEPAMPRKATKLFYKVDHYKNILSSGGVTLVSSEDELIDAVNTLLKDSSLQKAGRKKIVDDQCKFTDGRSGERIGKYILENLILR